MLSLLSSILLLSSEGLSEKGMYIEPFAFVKHFPTVCILRKNLGAHRALRVGTGHRYGRKVMMHTSAF